MIDLTSLTSAPTGSADCGHIVTALIELCLDGSEGLANERVTRIGESGFGQRESQRAIDFGVGVVLETAWLGVMV